VAAPVMAVLLALGAGHRVWTAMAGLIVRWRRRRPSRVAHAAPGGVRVPPSRYLIKELLSRTYRQSCRALGAWPTTWPSDLSVLASASVGLVVALACVRANRGSRPPVPTHSPPRSSSPSCRSTGISSSRLTWRMPGISISPARCGRWACVSGGRPHAPRLDPPAAVRPARYRGCRIPVGTSGETVGLGVGRRLSGTPCSPTSPTPSRGVRAAR